MSSPFAHPEWHALMAAIRAKPTDDLPRLVAADWLEDRGDSERAAAIRDLVQVRPTQEFWLGYDPFGRTTRGPNAKGVRDHESLLLTVRRGFGELVQCRLANWVGGECAWCDGLGDVPGTIPSGGGLPPMRRCTTCDGSGRWPARGPHLCRVRPILRVELTDAQPDPGSGGYWYWSEEWGERLPDTGRHLWELLWVTFDSPDEVAKAMSDALIAWALAQPVEQRA